MADYVSIYVDSLDVVDLSVYPKNDNSDYIVMQISGTNISVAPTENVNALIIPSGHGKSDATISGLLLSSLKDNPSEGIYYSTYINNTSQSKKLQFDPIRIKDHTWENTPFQLYWIAKLESTVAFNKKTEFVYSFPHNIQPGEIQLSGGLGGSDNIINYNIKWSGISNYDASEYSVHPSGGPYIYKVEYQYPDDNKTAVSDFISYNYTNVLMSTGISFQLPMYDARLNYQSYAIYKIIVNNNCAENINDPGNPGSNFFSFVVDHNKVRGYFEYDLDSSIPEELEEDKLLRIEENLIPPNTIDRTELRIGIEDINISENDYSKNGVYISNPINLDFNLYTFSMRVNEMIPDYSIPNKFDVVKYYVEFNGLEWERISPLTRSTEYFDDGYRIPKLMIFDLAPEKIDLDSGVRYFDLGININTFRIKIVFDLKDIVGSKFIPPEIKECKYVLFDKNKLVEAI